MSNHTPEGFTHEFMSSNPLFRMQQGGASVDELFCENKVQKIRVYYFPTSPVGSLFFYQLTDTNKLSKTDITNIINKIPDNSTNKYIFEEVIAPAKFCFMIVTGSMLKDYVSLALIAHAGILLGTETTNIYEKLSKEVDACDTKDAQTDFLYLLFLSEGTVTPKALLESDLYNLPSAYPLDPLIASVILHKLNYVQITNDAFVCKFPEEDVKNLILAKHGFKPDDTVVNLVQWLVETANAYGGAKHFKDISKYIHQRPNNHMVTTTPPSKSMVSKLSPDALHKLKEGLRQKSVAAAEQAKYELNMPPLHVVATIGHQQGGSINKFKNMGSVWRTLFTIQKNELARLNQGYSANTDKVIEDLIKDYETLDAKTEAVYDAINAHKWSDTKNTQIEVDDEVLKNLTTRKNKTTVRMNDIFTAMFNEKRRQVA